MPTTEVILTEKIASLGAEADVVKVKSGYARNFLVPSGKALEVTPATLRRINQLKAKRAEREAAELNEAEELARRINKLKITITLETGEIDRRPARIVWRSCGVVGVFFTDGRTSLHGVHPDDFESPSSASTRRSRASTIPL